MDALPQLPVSQAEAIREQARRNAVFSGDHNFIWLTLENSRLMRISGIEYVHVTPYIDEMAGNLTKFHLEIRGGETDFQWDSSRGAFRYGMLDSDHNRRFLASHFHLNIWRIEDQAIRREIQKMSDDIERQLKGEPKQEQKPAEPVVQKAPEPQKRKGGRPPKNRVVVDPIAAAINSEMVTPVARVVTP